MPCVVGNDGNSDWFRVPGPVFAEFGRHCNGRRLFSGYLRSHRHGEYINVSAALMMFFSLFPFYSNFQEGHIKQRKLNVNQWDFGLVHGSYFRYCKRHNIDYISTEPYLDMS